MKKKGARECVVVTVASKYVSDELFQRLGHEAYRRGDVNFQIPELPDISLRKVAPFSTGDEEDLMKAKNYLLEIFFEDILKGNPVRIIFKKTHRREKRNGT